MSSLLVLLSLAAIWLGFLAVERIQLEGHRGAVPLRIAITGTRGKTTVTRLLASVLRESGRTVLAKSTGSEAAYLYPDGSVREIRRRGVPSIIEQKRLLKLGAGLGADVVVAEIMSIHPEQHRVEAQQILRPHRVLVTNFRVDHVEAQGSTREAVAATLAMDVPPGAQALVPEEEWEEAFQEEVGRGGGTVVKVPAGAGPASEGLSHFQENLDLVWAAARSLGVADEAIRSGVKKAAGDVGRLRAWRYPKEGSGPKGAAAPGPGCGSWLVVNAFAANDPESTLLVHDRILDQMDVSAETSVGLLSLRADRGDRSLQWAEALAGGGLERFGRLLVTGLHARALRRRLRKVPGVERVELLGPDPPEAVMRAVTADGPGLNDPGLNDPGLSGPGLSGPGGAQAPASPTRLLFGFGNMGGLGEDLVRHWEQVGEPYGI